MRDRLLNSWGEQSARHPWRILAVGLLLLIGAFLSASRLEMSPRWSDLLPLEDPRVQEFNRILDNYSNASNSILVVQGPETACKAFADTVVPRIAGVTEFVERVEYRTDYEFLQRHGLLLSKTRDLRRTADLFENLALLPLLRQINENFEEVYTGDEESLSNREKEEKALGYLDALNFLLVSIDSVAHGSEPDNALINECTGRLTLGDTYFRSPDGEVLLIIIEPTFAITDISLAVAATDSLQAIIDQGMVEFPTITAGLTGTIPLARDEMVFSEADLSWASLLALALILGMLILAFRRLTAPLLALLNLVVALLIASGFIALFLQTLNIMTSMFGVILLGLGIDFSIHIITGFLDRRQHQPLQEALGSTLQLAGPGVLTGAITSAAAFMTLMISESRGIAELGLVLGVGILATALSTFFFLPSLLAVRDRFGQRRGRTSTNRPPIQAPLLGHWGNFAVKHPGKLLTGGILLTLVLAWQASQVKFDYNYLNMEPEGIPSVTLQDTLEQHFAMSPDFAMISTGNLEEVRRITAAAKELTTVGQVSSITEYLPTMDEQRERFPLLAALRTRILNSPPPSRIVPEDLVALVAELERLDANIYELGQIAYTGGRERLDKKCITLTGDPDRPDSPQPVLQLAGYLSDNEDTVLPGLNDFQNGFSPRLRARLLELTTADTITLAGLPDQIQDRFRSKDQEEFLVTVYPRRSAWDFNFLNAFAGQLEQVSPNITGTPPLFQALIDYIARDGILTTLLTILVVLAVLWIDFRSLKLALIAMIPLLAGGLWMVGLLHSSGLMLTFVNVTALPMIVGIGIDDGVHMIHRYRREGYQQAQKVLLTTGKAILLTTMTTMLGFGAMLGASYRGLVSLSSLLIIGVGACFLTTVLFLPPLFSLLKEK